MTPRLVELIRRAIAMMGKTDDPTIDAPRTATLGLNNDQLHIR